MDVNKSTPQGSPELDVSPLTASAIALHEAFTSYVAGGFSEKQALSLIAQMVMVNRGR